MLRIYFQSFDYGLIPLSKENSYDTFSPIVYGREEPFSKEVLADRYGDIENYEKMIIKATDDAIENGLILKEDRDESIKRAVQKAREYFSIG